MKQFKTWILPAIIITACFVFLPTVFDTWFGPVLGPTLGQSTGYVLSFCVAIISLWIMRYTDKKID